MRAASFWSSGAFSAAACMLALCAAGTAAAAPVSGAPAAAATPAHDAPRQTRFERHGTWGFSCAVAGDGKGAELERCMVSQIVASDPRKRQVVLGLTVDYVDSERVPTLRARFSPHAQRRAGIGIKVDATPDMRLAISDCDVRRCEAVGRLTPQVLGRLRGGKLAQFAFLQQGGAQVVLPVSLNGFGAALAALDRWNRNGARADARRVALR